MTIDLLGVLRDAGWQVDDSSAPLPSAIHSRYEWVPAEVIEFLESTRSAINSSETAWLITADAAAPEVEAFQWNAWENLGLQSAQTDSEWASDIRAFWDNHFPIANSVKSGYAYFAIRNAAGFPVVFGREPEFELPAVYANSFQDWQAKVAAAISGTEPDSEIESAF